MDNTFIKTKKTLWLIIKRVQASETVSIQIW